MKLSELSPEAREELLAELRQEEAQTAAPTSDSEEGVFTNTTGDMLYIPDLGMKTGDNFSAEAFLPGQTKDLKETYKLREIRASKHLPLRIKQGGLVKGRVEVDVSSKDPFADLARMRPDGSFGDPLSGKRPYDLKLQALEERERRDNGDVR